MKVIFKTNLDNYRTNCFPDNLTIPPRIGENVMVTKVFFAYFTNKNLPVKLKVVDVTWTDKVVFCELWYSEIDIKMAKQNNINLY